MSRGPKITALLVLLAALIGGGVYFYSHYSLKSHSEVQKDIYYCPMHPDYTSDRPGTCPICYMKLVKKENPAEGHSKLRTDQGHSVLSINPRKQQLIGVKTIPVEKKMLTKTIRAYGYVAHDLELYEAQLEYIEAWQAFYSYVVRRPTKDEFRSDWWKYYVQDPAQNRWRSEEKRKALERLVKADYELIHMGLSPVDIEKLREIKYGQPWVDPKVLFFRKDQPFWIYAQVLESDLGFIAPTQKVIATISAYNEKTEGVVRYVAPFVDPVTRTSRVRIEMPQYHGEMSVNMYVDVEMPVEFDTALVVPREAVMDTGLKKTVFVQTSEGVFEPRWIEIGFEGNGMVAVKSGLKEGELVVVSGNFLLDSESRLKTALEGREHVH